MAIPDLEIMIRIILTFYPDFRTVKRKILNLGIVLSFTETKSPSVYYFKKFSLRHIFPQIKIQFNKNYEAIYHLLKKVC